jgi:hypothetical protein
MVPSLFQISLIAIVGSLAAPLLPHHPAYGSRTKAVRLIQQLRRYSCGKSSEPKYGAGSAKLSAGLLHNAHRIEMKGPPMRKTKSTPRQKKGVKNEGRRFAPVAFSGGTESRPGRDRGSWANLRAYSCRVKTMDPAGGVENAKGSVSHPSLDVAARRPQAPQALLPSSSLSKNHILRIRAL